MLPGAPTTENTAKRFRDQREGLILNEGDGKIQYPIPAPNEKKEEEMYDYFDMINMISTSTTDASKTMFGDKDMGKKDYEIIETYRKHLGDIEFLQFFQKIYYAADPENKRHLNLIYPEFVNSMVALLQRKAEIMARWERLKLMAPESREDMLIMFLVLHKNLPEPNENWWIPTTQSSNDPFQKNLMTARFDKTANLINPNLPAYDITQSNTVMNETPIQAKQFPRKFTRLNQVNTFIRHFNKYNDALGAMATTGQPMDNTRSALSDDRKTAKFNLNLK